MTQATSSLTRAGGAVHHAAFDMGLCAAVIPLARTDSPSTSSGFGAFYKNRGNWRDVPI